MWQLAPRALDELVIAGRITEAIKAYAPGAYLTEHEGKRVDGHAAILADLEKFRESLAARYYVKKDHQPAGHQVTEQGLPKTESTLTWCVQLLEGDDALIEQRHSRTWSREWKILSEDRRTSTMPRRAPTLKQSLSKSLPVWLIEVVDYAHDFVETLGFPISLDGVPDNLVRAVRRESELFPLAVLSVLVTQMLQEKGARPDPALLRKLFRRAMRRLRVRLRFGVRGSGRVTPAVVIEEVTHHVTAFLEADKVETQHDLVVQWLENKYISTVLREACQQPVREDIADHIAQVAHLLVDPLHQTWIRVRERTQVVH